jgi:hypothetical protein
MPGELHGQQWPERTCHGCRAAAHSIQSPSMSESTGTGADADWIAVTLYGEDGKPLSAVDVQLTPGGQSQPTDSSGFVKFTGLPALPSGTSFYQIQVTGYAPLPILTRQSGGEPFDKPDDPLGAGSEPTTLQEGFNLLHQPTHLLSPRNTWTDAMANPPAPLAAGETPPPLLDLPIVAMLGPDTNPAGGDREFKEIFCGDQTDDPVGRYFKMSYVTQPALPIRGGQPGVIRVDQEKVIRQLRDEVQLTRTMGVPREFWIVTVPSSSEQRGHHTAWDRFPDEVDGAGHQVIHWVEPEYQARLRHAYLLLACGIARYVFISGGSIDPTKPWWNDALAGFQHMIDTYADHWSSLPGSITAGIDGHAHELKQRLIVDPWAIHSETNIRNGSRLSAALDLERTLISTTYGGKAAQGQWFTMGGFSAWCEDFCCCCNPSKQSFHTKCERKYGGRLGQFRELPRNISAGGAKIPGGCCGNEKGIFGTASFDFPKDKNPLYSLIPFQPRGPGASCSTYTTGIIIQWGIPQDLLLANKYSGWPPPAAGSSSSDSSDPTLVAWDHVDNRD